MWKFVCLLVIAQRLKESSQAGLEAGEKILASGSSSCVDENGIKYDNGAKWQVNNCQSCECVNGATIYSFTVCVGVPHVNCIEKPAAKDQCCPVYQCDALPCSNDQGSSHNDGDVWQVDKCKFCECQNATMRCNITVCGALPHESCLEKPTAEDRCCPEYQCDSLPCLGEQGSSHNDGESWQEDDCKHCKCDNGIQSCNTTICGGKPHESCVEKPASEGQCCQDYQCDALPCLDKIGGVYNDGDNWQVGKCKTCTCHNGTLTCKTKICGGKPEASCTVLPGTEDDCCPEYKCAPKSCTVVNGSVYEHGSQWHVDKCQTCDCYNGDVFCMTITCPAPPRGKYIALPAPGECCPEYELHGECMKDGKFYNHGEKTSDDPCTWCVCVHSQLFCTVWFCPSAGDGHKRFAVNEHKSHSLCRRVTPPGSCCPGKTIVCEQPISACQHDAPAVKTECNDHMCLNAHCKNRPDATCTISRCGHCHVIFIDNEGEQVDCGHSQNE